MKLVCAVILGIFMGFNVSAATYDLNYSGACVFQNNTTDCEASISFDLGPSSYGKKVPVFNTTGLQISMSGLAIGTLQILYFPDPDIFDRVDCTDYCAEATISESGKLLAFDFNTFGPGDFGFGSKEQVSAYIGSLKFTGLRVVPLPAAFPLFLGSIFLLGMGSFFRKRKFQKHH
ncbi:MAG: hypothetical protein ABJN40_13200 [Sneathiella sp.]